MSRAKDDAAASALARTLMLGTLDEKREAASELQRRAADMHDIRAAQPALAMAMHDPDPDLRRRAIRATAERVEAAGCDVGLAFPSLLSAVNDDDPDTRHSAWVIVTLADARHDEARRAFRCAATRAASDDPDARVREWAGRALAKLDRQERG